MRRRAAARRTCFGAALFVLRCLVGGKAEDWRGKQAMLHHFTGWLRAEARLGQGQKRWARLIGRGWARVTYGRHIEPTWLELNQSPIPVADLPSAFDGFKIAQLSDFHCSRQVSTAYLGEAVTL